MPKLKDLGALEPDMGSIEDKVGQLKQGLRSSFSDAVTKNPVGAAAKGIGRMMKDANVRATSKPDPADAGVYTADKGMPPSPDDMGSIEALKGRMRRPGMKKGGCVKKMSSGGKVGSASKRADGCAQRGKTKGKMI